MLPRIRLQTILARALYCWAALIISLGPSIDAMAGAARLAEASGRPSAILKAIAAFDVIDDTLDHLPGKGGADAQQQLVAPPLPPAPLADAAPPLIAGRRGWPVCTARRLMSCPSEALERPPRA